MNLILNQAKLKSCILDDRGEIKLPKFLSESHLMELSKEIFKLVVGYCFEAETDTVPGSHLNVMLDDNQIDFDIESRMLGERNYGSIGRDEYGYENEEYSEGRIR